MLDSRNPDPFGRAVNIPIELYEAIRGRYFIGYADNLTMKNGSSAWARLYNPRQSGVNLYVSAWNVTTMSDLPFRAQFWFNADPPGNAVESSLVTPSNIAARPQPRPRVRLQMASEAVGDPECGLKIFVRRGESGTTVSGTENGRLICPPGSSFLIFVTLMDHPCASGSARIGFEWWERNVNRRI